MTVKDKGRDRDRDRRPTGKKPSGGSGFKYHPRGEEEVRKRAEQRGGQFDSIFRSGVDRWRPKDGENVIRILPPTWENHEHYGYDIWLHSFVGPDKSTYLCPSKMLNKPCPICNASREAKRAGEEEEAKQLAATKRVAMWVIDRSEESTTPKLFDMSWSMDRDVAALCHNKRTGKVLLIDHPDKGYDISFSRTGKGLNTRYIGMAVDREDSPVMSDEDEQQQVLDYVQENPIPDQLKFYDEAYLENMISGSADEHDKDLDEDGDDDRPSKPSRKPSRRDEEEDVEEEAEEEERPRKPSRKPSRRDEDEDPAEDEEVEAEAEEEDDPPRKPARKPSRRDEEEVEEEVDVEEEADDEPDERPRKPARKPARRDESDDEPEDYEEDVEEEAEEEERPRKPSRKPAGRAPSRHGRR
jgi:hypothetical protein